LKILSFSAPYPPRNISVRFVNLNKNNWEEQSGSFPEETFLKSQDSAGKDKLFHFTDETPEIPSSNISSSWSDFNSSDYEATSQPSWWDSATAAPENEDEFVSVLPTKYENNTPLSGTEKSPSDSFSFFPVQMILSWLPPKPPTAFDGFNIHVEREGKTVGNKKSEITQEKEILIFNLSLRREADGRQLISKEK
jgi:receptor-type tyrosine-protein phosphatase O